MREELASSGPSCICLSNSSGVRAPHQGRAAPGSEVPRPRPCFPSSPSAPLPRLARLPRADGLHSRMRALPLPVHEASLNQPFLSDCASSLCSLS